MKQLIELATNARDGAYAPYSEYLVGAAVESESGEVFTGANVENVSYGATLCAERIAIAKLVNSGNSKIKKIAVASRDGGTPCGICLQTLLEFSPRPAEVEVAVYSVESGRTEIFHLNDLVPHGFKTDLKRS